MARGKQTHRPSPAAAAGAARAAAALEQAMAQMRALGVEGKPDIRVVRTKQHAPIRAYTHDHGCIEYTASGMSFKDWNRGYENWLAKKYSDEVKPWYLQAPQSSFARYNSEFGHALISSYISGIRKNVQGLRIVLGNESGMTVFDEFEHIYTQEQREDAVLKCFKRPIIASEKFSTSYPRDDCPELTVAWVTEGRNFRSLCEHLVPPEGSSEDVILFPNRAFSRLQDPESAPGGSSFVMSQGQRVYVHDGYMRRHVGLTTFCIQLVQTILGSSEEELEIKGIRRAPRISAEERKELSATLTPGAEATPPRYRPDAYKMCEQCNNYETTEKRFTCCAACKKKARREVFYCGRECQAEAAVEVDEDLGLVKSCFSQLRSGEPDPEHPDLQMLDSTFFYFDTLLHIPTCFYAVDLPAELYPLKDTGRRYARVRGTELKSFITPFDETLAAARRLAFSLLETRGQDRVAVGLIQRLYVADVAASKDAPAPAHLLHSMSDRFMATAFGIEPEEIAAMREETEAREDELRQVDDYRLVIEAIEQCELKALEHHGGHEEMMQRFAERYRSTGADGGGKKRRNRKKKKKAKGKTADEEEVDGTTEQDGSEED